MRDLCSRNGVGNDGALDAHRPDAGGNVEGEVDLFCLLGVKVSVSVLFCLLAVKVSVSVEGEVVSLRLLTSDRVTDSNVCWCECRG